VPVALLVVPLFLLLGAVLSGAPESGSEPGRQAADRQPIAEWPLPRVLAEISGLALTADGRLLAHNDEVARIFEIDFRRGAIVKSFGVGRPLLRGDFEGIAVAGDSIYLLASNGRVVAFREGKNAEEVEYRIRDPGLSPECEFEGIAFEPAANSLVLACKDTYRAADAGSLVLFRLPLSGAGGGRATRLSIPPGRIAGFGRSDGPSPTDLTIDAVSGHLVLVAARARLLIELTPAGEVVRAERLPSRHVQAEGIAISGGGGERFLIVSDESVQWRQATITVYRWP